MLKYRFIAVGLTTLFLSSLVYAKPLPPQVQRALSQIEDSTLVLKRNAEHLGDGQSNRVLIRLRGVRASIKQIIDDLKAPSTPQGQWFSAIGQQCNTFCARVGLRSTVSADGAQCASGEIRPFSAAGKINYAYGCWKGCAPQANTQSVSIGQFCYSPSSKHDNDRTDITVGCYCR